MTLLPILDWIALLDATNANNIYTLCVGYIFLCLELNNSFINDFVQNINIKQRETSNIYMS